MVSRYLKRFECDQSGATSIEYGLIAALMAVAIIACLTAFGPQMKAGLSKIGTDMSSPQDVTAG
ncbi:MULTISPECIES: Flp family type IVb pilin [unclassified Brevundimonas]|uniref:Flp family type IVb pilin n=1 Tax=unclassified Brevundimonas TaxID=2622653 RepID=UPI001E2AB599|nr:MULTISPECIES: Flp family type IVb pilin [unclassified Brevundimonas]